MNARTSPARMPSQVFDGVEPLVARRLEVELRGVFVERYEFGLRRDADGPLTLDVGVAADRGYACALTPDVALEQEQVQEHPDVLEPVLVLGKAHSVDADDAFRLDVDVRGAFDRCARKPGLRLDGFPGRLADLRFKRFESGRVTLDEVIVEHAPASPLCVVICRKHALADAEDRGDVAAGANLMVLRADAGLTAGQHLADVLGVGEIFEALLPHRIESDDRHASLGDVLKRMEKPRAVRPRILAKKEHGVAFLKIVINDRADADPDQFLQRHRCRFVAHVRAVGQIVVAVHPRHQRIEIGRLQTCAA